MCVEVIVSSRFIANMSLLNSLVILDKSFPIFSEIIVAAWMSIL